MQTTPFNSPRGTRSAARRLAAGLAVTGALLVPAAALAETLKGTAGDDTIVGTEGQDVIHARAGNDVIRALAGLDRVHAGGGNDTVEGGDSHDLIRGGDGNDNLSGGDGPDRIFAGQGVDKVDGGDGDDNLWALARKDVQGEDDATGDSLSGGAGDDRFHTRDGEKDTIDCGDGRDRVLADYRDEVLNNCDKVIRRPAQARRGAQNRRDRAERLEQRK